jgi:hypothetical protein
VNAPGIPTTSVRRFVPQRSCGRFDDAQGRLSPSTISFLRIAQTVAVDRMALSYQLISGEFVGVMVRLAAVQSADSKD